MVKRTSELERCAHSLAAAKRSIAILEQHSSGSATAGAGISSNSAAEVQAGAASLSVSNLQDRAHRLETTLVARAHEKLSQLIATATAPQSSKHYAQDASIGPAVVFLRCQAISHILRLFYVLSRGDVAETMLADVVVSPLVR
jgi:hypothetical protein